MESRRVRAGVGVGVMIVAIGAGLALAGVFASSSPEALSKLGTPIEAKPFTITALRVECHKTVRDISQKTREYLGPARLPGELCFGVVKIVGPTIQEGRINIPPLIVDALEVGEDTYRDVGNSLDAKASTESGPVTTAVLDSVFTIPKGEVPTVWTLEGINQTTGVREFSKHYRLPGDE